MNAPASDSQRVFAYHARSKHRLEAYARGPETLDWSAQPDPFRRFLTEANGSIDRANGNGRVIPLPLTAQELNTRFDSLYLPLSVTAKPMDIGSLGALFELSMAITAWKEYGPDRWALRANPSSGNLHPTEAYLVTQGVAGLQNGVYHYLSRDHCLEQRAELPTPAGTAATTATAWIGLSSIHWREAWKYGERAFRYCQLDVGHALGGLRYAAAALGWEMRVLDTCSSDELAALLGLDRSEDFGSAEREEPEVLVALYARDRPATAPTAWPVPAHWHGKANVLDPHPMYHWPVIDEVAHATRKPPTDAIEPGGRIMRPALSPPCAGNAAAILLKRRSAQHFDRRHVQDAASFWRMLDALLPRAAAPAPAAPWDLWHQPPRVHPVIFVHRVADVTPGVYALPRSADGETLLREHLLQPEFRWESVPGAPAHLPLWRLLPCATAKTTRTLSCHQAIAADCTFTVAMLAEFAGPVGESPWRYRQLYWEAGLVGQVLYLEAEAAGLRGTGIGCYFDDAIHALLGLQSETLQSLYHFTVGMPMIDERITTLPPYAASRYPATAPSGEPEHSRKERT